MSRRLVSSKLTSTGLLLLTILLSMTSGCADPTAARTAMANAKAAFEEFEQENPPRHQVQRYEDAYFRAEKAMEAKEYEEAERYAKKAQRIVEDAMKEWAAFKKQLEKRRQEVLTQIELRLKSYDSLEDAYDNAVAALSERDYEKADAFLSQAEEFLRSHQIVGKQIVFLTTDPAQAHQNAWNVTLYDVVIPETGKLANPIGKAVRGTQAQFVRAWRINRSYRLYRVRIPEGIEGWVYPQNIDTTGESL